MISGGDGSSREQGRSRSGEGRKTDGDKIARAEGVRSSMGIQSLSLSLFVCH